jgi:hypothetical protein
MSEERTLLEHRIALAFSERADALADRPVCLVGMAQIRGRRRSRSLGLAVASVAVVLAVVAIVALRPFIDRRAHRTGHPTTTGLTTVTTQLPPRPPGAVGDEVPLSFATNFDTEFLSRLQRRQNPGANPIAVQIPGRAAIVVTGNCMTIAAAPTPAGYQGSCTGRDQVVDHVIGTLDTGPSQLPTTVAYGAWVAVPHNAAVVTMTYGAQHAWQRPLAGVSYFTFVGATPPLGPVPVVLRAYDDHGRQVGEARRTPYHDPPDDPIGTWQW